MGRVYDVSPDVSKGERGGPGYSVFTHSGQKLLGVRRVEFDADADEGMATVWQYPTAEGGYYFTAGPTGDAVGRVESPVATFRAVVAIRPKATN